MRAIGEDPRQCILVVGAGLSRKGVRERGRGLPDWARLCEEMIRDLEESEGSPSRTGERLRPLLEKEQFLDVAQEFKRRRRPDQFAEFLRDQLAPGDFVRSRIHETILETEFRGIVTTNFDTVLEFHNSRREPPLPVHVYPHFLSDPAVIRRPRFLLKLHGCVETTQDPYENLILTSNAYERLRREDRYQELLRTLVLGYVILTVGFSWRDPDFVGLMEDLREVFGERLPTVYALMIGASGRRRRRLRKKGVEVVSVKGRHAVVEFLTELRELSEVKYPSVRLDAPPLFPIRLSDVKGEAWEYFSIWRRDRCWSPVFGEVKITRRAWKHMTRVSRPQREACHKLSLLPCARELIQKARSARRVRVLVNPRRPSRIQRELYVLRGPHKSPFQADIKVEVVIEVAREPDGRQTATLLSVLERRV